MAITREALLGSFQRKYRDVPTSAGVVRIQNLNEEETEAYQDGQFQPDGKLCPKYQKARRRKLVSAVLVDDNGQRLLQKGDELRLAGVGGDVIFALFLAALEHCGMTGSDEEGDAKNAVPGDGTTSDTGSPVA